MSLFQGIQLFAVGLNQLSTEPDRLLPRLRLDPNRARLPELMLLPGIGRQRAEAIILRRIRWGPFRRVEDLADVPGLGPKTLAELSSLLRIADEGV